LQLLSLIVIQIFLMTSNPNDDAMNNNRTKNIIAIVAIGALLIGSTAALPAGSFGLINGQQAAAQQQNQTQEQQNQTQTSNATVIVNKSMTDTFSAYGKITGTIQEGGGGGSSQQTNTSASNTTQSGNQTNMTQTAGASSSSSPFLVGGDWILDVENGNVTNFKTNFTMVRTDGSEHHSHDITNFKLGNNTQFQLDPRSTSTINGTADYAVNGTSTWPGSDTTITIEKARILSIQPDEQEVRDHFQGQPIYGIVLQAEGENGTLIAESAPAGGNQSQQQQGGGAEAPRNPLEGLFGGGQ